MGGVLEVTSRAFKTFPRGLRIFREIKLFQV